MAMGRGNLSLGRLSPCLVAHGIQTPKTKPTQSLPHDSSVPSLPCEHTPQQLTPGLSGTQWLEDLFRGKQPKFHLIYMFDSSELTVPPFGEPYQTDESPVPDPSPSSKPHEDVLTHEPEPEVPPTQSMKEPFNPLHSYPGSLPVPLRTPPPPPLIPMMRLTSNLPIYNQP
ncbi:hypothetical protein O181_046746 [Austropuccinia psidii MF-1]|uniref:Uncharacterized protein n=1 Tax=Austropuccinia psidii MF-1 TaxID=1389203 RepID=A0A9Q3DMI2_9BASI|nr:hypothetical protein [Austropuccinia psidii MF-1]